MEPSPPPFAPPPAPKSTSWRAPVGILAVAAVLVAAILGYGWWSRQQAPAPAPPPEPVAAAPDASVPDSAPALPVAQSDARVRELVGLLSPLPELQKWLSSTEDLVRRFASAVGNVAEGESPRAALSFLAPGGSFQTVSRDGHLFIAPASFARYDTVARVVASLDTRTSVLTYQSLKSLIDGAFQEISRPGQRFEQTLANAVARLVDTPVPEGDVEVVDTPGVNFAFAAPELEALSPAQKHLVRLGPANARAIQAKLRELRDALALPPPAP
jgi:hypothetical protein